MGNGPVVRLERESLLGRPEMVSPGPCLRKRKEYIDKLGALAQDHLGSDLSSHPSRLGYCGQISFSPYSALPSVKQDRSEPPPS